MSKEMVISGNRHETKVAILEDDQLVEIFFQRSNEYSLAGSIHKGRVTRVLPGMQSAFVDLGLERDTFLYVSDFFEENEDFDRIAPAKEDRPPRAERTQSRTEPPVTFSSPDPEPIFEEPEMPEMEFPLETAPVAPPSAPAPGGERREEGGDRGDPRNRRSRRRRNRGRGFPESKYASEQNEPTAARTPEPAPLPPPVAAEPQPQPHIHTHAPVVEEFEFPVLPGESLAKYSRPTASGHEPEERNEPIAPAPVHHTPDPALMQNEPTAAPEVEEPFEAPLTTVELIESEEFDAIAITAEDDDLGEPVESTYPGELDEPEMEPETLESTAQPAASASEEPASGQTASVREPGNRYMHRMPRRMRRKGRGGAPGQDGPTHNPAGSAARMEPRSEAGPESRIEPRAESRMEPPPPPQRTVVAQERSTPSITELLKEGQEILVQIAKEPLGQKGARITSHIALPGRYVVYMPTLEHMGVSRKIASDDERLRLKKILQAHRGTVQGGFIVRTAGEGKTEEEIAADMSFLGNLWLDIRQKAERKPAPLLLHHDLDIVQRILRDQFTENFKSIWVDTEEAYESILRFVQRFQPSLVSRVKLYTRPAPIFDAFNITQELEKALRPKVWLKSGGYIVINQTEALVAIDVNTGKYVGKSNRLEDTIVKTNTEAVKEIVRQIRLRDLGGIIVVDFIDMDERKNRQKVMQTLEETMRADKAPYKILQFNDFGLVAITRKRVKQSLERTLCSPCPYCEGAGYVKSVQTTVGEILQEAHKIARAVEGKDVLLRVHPEVAKYLKSNQNKHLEEMEEILRRPVLIKADPLLHQEKFDLA